LIQFYFGANLYGTLPHEYYGHFARAKAFGLNPNFTIAFPELGGDVIFKAKQSMPAYERQMIVAAGPEVTATIAYKATQQLYSNVYSPSYSGNYFFVGRFVDNYMYYQTSVKPFRENANKYYAEHKDYFQRNPVPNDPVSYLLGLTEGYGYYNGLISPDSTWVQQLLDMNLYTANSFFKNQANRMKQAYLLTAMDPSNLYFLYANALYILKGQRFFKPFMFRISGVSFMPSVRANMGDIGMENYFDVFFKARKLPPFSIYYRNGGNIIHKLRGAGAEFRHLVLNDRVSLNGQLDYWYNQRNNSNNIHFAAGAYFEDKQHLFFLSGNLGYKSSGNLMGKPLEKGVYGNLGLGLNLRYSAGINTK